MFGFARITHQLTAIIAAQAAQGAKLSTIFTQGEREWFRRSPEILNFVGALEGAVTAPLPEVPAMANKLFDKTSYQREYMRKRRAALRVGA